MHSCGSAIEKLIDTRLKNVEIDRQATSTHRFLRRDVWQDICFCANNAYVDVLNGGCSMKTLMFGLVIAIVYLATYFISAMERAW